MSVEGFVESMKRRRIEVCREIERLTILNDGVLPKKNDAEASARKRRSRPCNLSRHSQRDCGVYMTPMTEAQFLSRCAGPRHTPEDTLEAIQELLKSLGYEDAAEHVFREWELINSPGGDDEF